MVGKRMRMVSVWEIREREDDHFSKTAWEMVSLSWVGADPGEVEVQSRIPPVTEADAGAKISRADRNGSEAM